MSEETQENNVATEQEGKQIKYDFKNSDDLIEQLEKVELTEEDTEELLIEAYRMNMMLKEVLRSQEAAKKKKQKSKIGTSSSQLSLNTRSTNRSHRRSPGSVLPPIHRSETTLVTRNHSKQTDPGFRAATSLNLKGRISAGPSRNKTKSAVDRPDWDDRFSFS